MTVKYFSSYNRRVQKCATKMRCLFCCYDVETKATTAAINLTQTLMNGKNKWYKWACIIISTLNQVLLYLHLHGIENLLIPQNASSFLTSAWLNCTMFKTAKSLINLLLLIQGRLSKIAECFWWDYEQHYQPLLRMERLTQRDLCKLGVVFSVER